MSYSNWSESHRAYAISALVIVAALTLLIIVAVLGFNAAHQNTLKVEHMSTACVNSGGQWVSGNCIKH